MYDSLDEYHVSQIPDEVWARLTEGAVPKAELSHNAFVSLRAMDLISVSVGQLCRLTPQGRTYAQMVLTPPL